MGPSLRDPLNYPNWVLMVGIGLIVVALVVAIGVGVAYLRSRVSAPNERMSLSQARRARYERLIEEVGTDYRHGALDSRGAHLALAAIIRAAASERLGQNVESLSVDEATKWYAHWPALAQSLQWCEIPSFHPGSEADEIDRGEVLAREVISA